MCANYISLHVAYARLYFLYCHCKPGIFVVFRICSTRKWIHAHVTCLCCGCHVMFVRLICQLIQITCRFLFMFLVYIAMSIVSMLVVHVMLVYFSSTESCLSMVNVHRCAHLCFVLLCCAVCYVVWCVVCILSVCSVSKVLLVCVMFPTVLWC